LKRNPNIRLLVFDPLASYLGAVKKNAESDMRRLLLGLRNLAEETGVAVIAIDHFNKNSEQAALHRLSGSQALGAAPRAVWGFVRDPEDDTRRIMMHAKLNLVAESDKSNVFYTFKSAPITIEDQGTTMPVIEWGETTKRQLDEVLRADRHEGQLDLAVKRMVAQLTEDGPTLSEESDNKMQEAGFSPRTIERARTQAKRDGQVQYKKVRGAHGKFIRYLPGQEETATRMAESSGQRCLAG
jgi:RecA-family ATPase